MAAVTPVRPPLWISHRGCRDRGVRENSLRAFEQARACGFAAMETDLRPTRDGALVLCHDASLRRLFDVPLAVEESDLQTLHRRGLLGPDGLATLDDLAEQFPDTSWTFDIKPERGERTVRLLAQWRTSRPEAEAILENARLLFWSRRQEALWRRRFPDTEGYARRSECWLAAGGALCGLPMRPLVAPGRTYALPPRLGPLALFRPALPRRYRRAGARTVAFLPCADEEAREAAAAGFDQILTDGKPVEG